MTASDPKWCFEVRCGVCGVVDTIYCNIDWYRSKCSFPALWICDVHRGDWR